MVGQIPRSCDATGRRFGKGSLMNNVDLQRLQLRLLLFRLFGNDEFGIGMNKPQTDLWASLAWDWGLADCGSCTLGITQRRSIGLLSGSLLPFPGKQAFLSPRRRKIRLNSQSVARQWLSITQRALRDKIGALLLCGASKVDSILVSYGVLPVRTSWPPQWAGTWRAKFQENVWLWAAT